MKLLKWLIREPADSASPSCTPPTPAGQLILALGLSSATGGRVNINSPFARQLQNFQFWRLTRRYFRLASAVIPSTTRSRPPRRHPHGRKTGPARAPPCAGRSRFPGRREERPAPRRTPARPSTRTRRPAERRRPEAQSCREPPARRRAGGIAASRNWPPVKLDKIEKAQIHGLAHHSKPRLRWPAASPCE